HDHLPSVDPRFRVLPAEHDQRLRLERHSRRDLEDPGGIIVITWLPRSFWTDTPPGGHPKPHESFRRLVIHHTVMALPDFDRDGVFFGDLDDIREYMIRLSEARPDLYWRGRPEVPYSFVHFYGERPEDGIVVEGRGFGRTGAHTGNWNSKVYGCAAA